MQRDQQGSCSPHPSAPRKRPCPTAGLWCSTFAQAGIVAALQKDLKEIRADEGRDELVRVNVAQLLELGKGAHIRRFKEGGRDGRLRGWLREHAFDELFQT